MKTLAIKGDKERGNEVIALLEMLGGSNRWKASGEIEKVYYSISNGGILYGPQLEKGTVVFTLDEFYKKYPYKIGDKVIDIADGCPGVVSEIKWDEDVSDMKYCVVFGNGIDFGWYANDSIEFYKENKNMEKTKVETTGFMQVGKTLAVIFNDANYEDEVELQLGDYKIEVRDGKTYAVKKKPVYPKNYKECCSVLMGKTNFSDFRLVPIKYSNTTKFDNEVSPDAPHIELFNNLYKIFICRNAYWKIAGEQLGLDKPWEPKFGKCVLFDITFYLYQDNFVLHKAEYRNSDNCILVFPTEEMRDAFYENFKDLIEKCKELL